ncbi:MAG: antioxidant, AhpC/TSA family [Gammaproteobacteria bacterium]|jgi:peroxiredoxin (alkyl hydroperoxide reductase subunit C)|nr:antioxidant, AhpC/TSA family [Gammaproteobacteria bacterium]
MSISLVRQKAPDFTAAAVLADGQITQYNLGKAIAGKYALIFFYPLDFTFVCPTELIALDHRIGEFKDRNVEVVGISIDSEHTHSAWRNTPIEKGGIGPLRYTLVADIKHEISRAYGVEHPEIGVSLRGAFLIDREGIVRSMIVNDLPIGRNIDELLRLVDALEFSDNHGDVCPAGWQKGNQAMKASSQGVRDYLAANAEAL